MVMKVILKEDVGNIGEMGDIVNVSSGYARNCLIPKNMAVTANTRNIKSLEHEKRLIQEKIKRLKGTAEDLAAKIGSLSLTLTAKAGEEGKLFGSITTKDIVEALGAEDITIDKRKIVLDDPIKRIGEHSVRVKVHPDVVTDLKIQVVSE